MDLEIIVKKKQGHVIPVGITADLVSNLDGSLYRHWNLEDYTNYKERKNIVIYLI